MHRSGLPTITYNLDVYDLVMLWLEISPSSFKVVDQAIFLRFLTFKLILLTCIFYSYAKGDLDISYITSRIAGRYPPLPSTLHNSFTVEVKLLFSV